MIKFEHNDGGRSAAGYKGDAGDCVTRAIAIATRQDYTVVLNELASRAREARKRARTKKHGSPRNGVHRNVYEPYIKSLGWIWTPTMKIGQGCKVHLRADELPPGRLIVTVSRHVCAVLDGVLHDTHDCSRGGKRCVYGYYSEPASHPG